MDCVDSKISVMYNVGGWELTAAECVGRRDSSGNQKEEDLSILDGH
jgi:hypothetical protein